MKTTFEKDQQSRMEPALKSGEGVKFEKAITINRPISEIYAFWRNLENLPSFMKHLESVSATNEQISHWVVRTSPNKTTEWDAEIIEDRRDELISWRSLPGADVQNAGSVWFTEAPGNRGTVLKFSLKYAPPGGKFGAAIAKIFGKDARAMIEDDLFRLKSLLETGETPTVENQSHGNN
jgi:uncharacterized membrane protein